MFISLCNHFSLIPVRCWLRPMLVILAGTLAVPALVKAGKLAPAPSPVDNPLKGLVPYVGARPSRFPHSMEFSYLKWADFMKGPDSFDWQVMETFLSNVSDRGHHAIFRIWMDYPGSKSAVPEFLLRQGVKLTEWMNASSSTKNFTPDYNDERLVVALENFILALGEKYDGDPRIGFITAGLLGSWGEWHNWPRNDLFASKATQARVMSAYEQAFRKTHVLLRYPVGPGDAGKAANAQLRMGYHDDSFGWGTLATGKADDAWYYLPSLKLAGTAALEKWRTQPIGGEIRPEVWGQIFDARPAHPQAQDFGECVRQTHASWVMDSGMFREQAAAARYERACEQVRGMGYDFYVQSSEITREKEDVKVSLKVINQGVAPFYYDWRVEVATAKDASADQITAVDWKLTELQPNDPARLWEASLKLPAETAAGKVIVIRVRNPIPAGKPLRFANADDGHDVVGWLSVGKVP